MQIGVARQYQPGETRCPLVPAVVKRLVQRGVSIAVEAGTGVAAGFEDGAYEQAGATIVSANDAGHGLWAASDVVVTLNAPTTDQAEQIKEGAVLIGMLGPMVHVPLMQMLAQKRVTSFSMEFLPRTSRAQAMDVLSSQANIGGFKAVLIAANHCPKIFPMMITAAGTLAPAKVFVLGAGVAGLQAIATAKRLGAVVEAYDVRAATKEQIQSLGARFVELPAEAQSDATTGGYAKEQTEEEQQKQTELMSKHLLAADVVIATAAVFGKAPPMLIPTSVVEQMSRGTVIVDLAADPFANRGNCESTKPGEVHTTDNGVTIVGTLNLPTLAPTHASQAYANNMLNFLNECLDEEGNLTLNMEDDLLKQACMTHEGELVNEMLREKAANA